MRTSSNYALRKLAGEGSWESISSARKRPSCNEPPAYRGGDDGQEKPR
jgi:hypothetical protein